MLVNSARWVLCVLCIFAALWFSGPAGAAGLEKEWFKTYGGSVDETVSAARETPDGGFVFCGSSFSFATGEEWDPTGFVTKTDSRGAVEWRQTFGGNRFNNVQTIAEVTARETVVLATLPGLAYQVVTLNEKGSVLEEQAVVCQDSHGQNCMIREFAMTRDGDFLVLTNGDIRKLDAESNLLWKRELLNLWGPMQFPQRPENSRLLEAPDGDFCMAARFSNGTGLVKFDSEGRKKWERRFGGMRGWPVSLLILEDGDVVVGVDTSGFGLIRVSAEGEIRWQKVHCTLNVGYYGVASSRDHGLIIVTAELGPPPSMQPTKIGARGLDDSGDVLWVASNVLELAAPSLKYFDGTADGGLILVGDALNECQRDPYLLKLRFGDKPLPRFLRGDASGDGRVNLTDAVRILLHLFQGTQLGCRDAGDSNDDAQLNLTDAIFLLNFLFLSGPTIPAPFPAPGPDPTEDDLGCANPL